MRLIPRRVTAIIRDIGYLARVSRSPVQHLRHVASRVRCRERVELRIRGHRILVRNGTPDLKVVASSLGSEFDVPVELLARTSRRTVVLDLGGYIGTAALRFARAIPGCTVITVEPSPENFQVLRKNIEGHANIVAINAAVGSRAETRELYDQGKREWGLTLVPPEASNARPVARVAVLSIEQILDHYCEPGVPISLVKIDIEGAEIELLDDPRWLDQCAVAMIELHDFFVPGCSDKWRLANAAAGRECLAAHGEKVISVAPDVLASIREGVAAS